MLISLLIIFIMALLAPLLVKRFKQVAGTLLALAPAALFCYFLSFYRLITSEGIARESYVWVNRLDIHLSFHLDGLSLLFALLVLGIGTLVLIYSNGYMREDKHQGRFYAFMLVFMGAMLGLVLSSNLICLYVFWELTSITSFLLIGFYHEKKKARTAAMQSLLITEIGGLALLAAFILIGKIAGTYQLSGLLTKQQALTEDPLYLPVLILFLIGVFTKSAQFPFHFWLRLAMRAPTPVSAYLHSAAMVNAGIYLLARLHPVLGSTSVWQTLITITGAVTMLVGAYLSLTQKDMKAMLAYVTISALGILTMLFGLGSFLSVKAALTYLVVHALYKATLFMVAGTIDHQTGTRNIYQLGNLRGKMPVSTIIATLALLSMAGIPPMLGYISKEFIYEAGSVAPQLSIYIVGFTVLSNALMVAASLMFAYQVFFKKGKVWPANMHDAGITFWIGPAILATLSLVLAVFPALLEPLMESAVVAVKVFPLEVELRLWHGLNVVFVLSLATVATGILLFIYRKQVLSILRTLNRRVFSTRFSLVFSNGIDVLEMVGRRSSRAIQHGYYRFYVITILLVCAALMWYHLVITWSKTFLSNLSEVSVYVSALTLMTIVAAVMALLTRSRMVTIVTMGVVGYGIALLYLTYGAVDLAITQILVETLTLVMFVMMLYKLPRFTNYLSARSRARDLAIALSVGGCMAALALKSNKLSLGYPVSSFLSEHSFTDGHGKNIVNVILVDFRALDTMGEVTVLSLAALGAYALLKFKPKEKKI